MKRPFLLLMLSLCTSLSAMNQEMDIVQRAAAEESQALALDSENQTASKEFITSLAQELEPLVNEIVNQLEKNEILDLSEIVRNMALFLQRNQTRLIEAKSTPLATMSKTYVETVVKSPSTNLALATLGRQANLFKEALFLQFQEQTTTAMKDESQAAQMNAYTLEQLVSEINKLPGKSRWQIIGLLKLEQLFIEHYRSVLEKNYRTKKAFMLAGSALPFVFVATMVGLMIGMARSNHPQNWAYAIGLTTGGMATLGLILCCCLMHWSRFNKIDTKKEPHLITLLEQLQTHEAVIGSVLAGINPLAVLFG